MLPLLVVWETNPLTAARDRLQSEMVVASPSAKVAGFRETEAVGHRNEAGAREQGGSVQMLRTTRGAGVFGRSTTSVDSLGVLHISFCFSHFAFPVVLLIFLFSLLLSSHSSLSLFLFLMFSSSLSSSL